MALPVARKISPAFQATVTTPALVSSRNWVSGDVWMNGTRACVYVGKESLGAGVTAVVELEGAWEMPCASGVTAALDAQVNYDTANKTVVTTATGGAIVGPIGRLRVAKTSGQLVAIVDLNR